MSLDVHCHPYTRIARFSPQVHYRFFNRSAQPVETQWSVGILLGPGERRSIKPTRGEYLFGVVAGGEGLGRSAKLQSSCVRRVSFLGKRDPNGSASIGISNNRGTIQEVVYSFVTSVNPGLAYLHEKDHTEYFTKLTIVINHQNVIPIPLGKNNPEGFVENVVYFGPSGEFEFEPETRTLFVGKPAQPAEVDYCI